MKEMIKDNHLAKQAKQAKANVNPHAAAISEMMEKLKLLRRENQEGHTQMTISLTKLETWVEDLKCQITSLGSRSGDTAEWIEVVEEIGMRHERTPIPPGKREADLTKF